MSRSTSKPKTVPAPPTEISAPPEVVANFTLLKVAELLIREQGLHEGRYEAGFQFALTVGKFGLQPGAAPIPGVVTCISDLALLRSPIDSPMGVDAAEVNPRPVKLKLGAKRATK